MAKVLITREIKQALLNRNLSVSQATISRAILQDTLIEPLDTQQRHELTNNTLYSSHDDIFIKTREFDGSPRPLDP